MAPGPATRYDLPLPRIVACGRPFSDPACAGCAQLGVFRALRRAGLEVQGGSGCDPGGKRTFTPSAGRWAAVCGAAEVLADAEGTVAAAAAAGARLVLLADRDGVQGRRAARLLSRAASGAIAVAPADLLATEAAVREAALAPSAALVALTPCARLARRVAPLTIASVRCNRCGACLALGCPAISDAGGESMVVDPALCSGCGLCGSLCRARALGPRR